MLSYRALALCLPFAVACTAPAPTPAPAPTEAEFRDWVENRYTAPFKRGDTDVWMEIFADDAVALHNRRTADVGKDAIAAFGTLVASTFNVDEMNVNVESIRTNGDWAYTRGTYENAFSFRGTGEPAPWGREQGKFFFLWERQDDGEWKIIVDMGNSVE